MSLFGCVSFKPFFSTIFTSTHFTVWFSNRYYRYQTLFRAFSSSLSPIRGCLLRRYHNLQTVFPIYLNVRHCFCFNLNFIRLLFTSLCLVSSGRNDVILLHCDFGIKVDSEPLSMKILVGRLMTTALKVKNSGLSFFFEGVEWIFWFIEWFVFNFKYLLSHYLFIVPVCGLFFCLSCNISRNGHSFLILLIFPLAGHTCCRDRIVAQHLSIFLSFAGFFIDSSEVLVFFYGDIESSSRLLFPVSRLVFHTCTHLMLRLFLLPTCRSFYSFS